MGTGVKVVGAVTSPEGSGAPRADGPSEGGTAYAEGLRRHLGEPRATGADDRTGPGRRRPRSRRRAAFVGISTLAVLGLAGTAAFASAWAGLHARQQGEVEVRATARTFLRALTNFDARTVDADFNAITNMATGQFAGQANRFFNSAIRQELQTALALSRGQIRSSYVESYGGGAATVYAVVDQLYANNKITAPQSDVLRLVVGLARVSGGWKVSDVTVLEGPSPTSPTPGAAGSAAAGGSSPGTGGGSAATTAPGA